MPRKPKVAVFGAVVRKTPYVDYKISYISNDSILLVRSFLQNFLASYKDVLYPNRGYLLPDTFKRDMTHLATTRMSVPKLIEELKAKCYIVPIDHTYRTHRDVRDGVRTNFTACGSIMTGKGLLVWVEEVAAPNQMFTYKE